MIRPIEPQPSQATHGVISPTLTLEGGTLAKLVKRGLVEQKRRSDSVQSAFGSKRAGKLYRITDAGRAALAAVAHEEK